MNVPLIALILFALDFAARASVAPLRRAGAVTGKSGRRYTVIRIPSRTKRFRVQFQPTPTKQIPKPNPMFWEADFDGPKPRVASIRVSADTKMIDDVMAFPPSVWE